MFFGDRQVRRWRRPTQVVSEAVRDLVCFLETTLKLGLVWACILSSDFASRNQVHVHLDGRAACFFSEKFVAPPPGWQVLADSGVRKERVGKKVRSVLKARLLSKKEKAI